MSNSDRSSPVVTNCTFSDNQIVGNSEGAGGMSNLLESSPTITNTIFWGNLPEQVDYDDPNSIRKISYSLVEGGSAGIGNIDANPLFVDAPADDLHLQAGSFAIDAGNNALTDGPLDLDLDNRFKDDPATADTGIGSVPIVDMGAYEYGISMCLCANGLAGDINCDGIVNMFDLALLALHWLETI